MKYDLEFFRPYNRASWPLNSLLEDVFSQTNGHATDGASKAFAPVCEINEDEGHYYVSADLPGVKKEDVKVELNDGYLTVSGERKSETKKDERNFHLRETSYGRFSRSFKIGEGIEGDKIEARFQDGVLQLQIPKSQAKKPRQIKIN
ncbi:Hsp20/alpha crystallin family protein [bacterium]|nr:Hsp20/alpha crystallin family protein [bacterium]